MCSQGPGLCIACPASSLLILVCGLLGCLPVSTGSLPCSPLSPGIAWLLLHPHIHVPGNSSAPWPASWTPLAAPAPFASARPPPPCLPTSPPLCCSTHLLPCRTATTTVASTTATRCAALPPVRVALPCWLSSPARLSCGNAAGWLPAQRGTHLQCMYVHACTALKSASSLPTPPLPACRRWMAAKRTMARRTTPPMARRRTRWTSAGTPMCGMRWVCRKQGT